MRHDFALVRGVLDEKNATTPTEPETVDQLGLFE
jgi:hypothetical protein